MLAEEEQTVVNLKIERNKKNQLVLTLDKPEDLIAFKILFGYDYTASKAVWDYFVLRKGSFLSQTNADIKKAIEIAGLNGDDLSACLNGEKIYGAISEYDHSKDALVEWAKLKSDKVKAYFLAKEI